MLCLSTLTTEILRNILKYCDRTEIYVLHHTSIHFCDWLHETLRLYEQIWREQERRAMRMAEESQTSHTDGSHRWIYGLFGHRILLETFPPPPPDGSGSITDIED
jgi:hypothetical protein